jgi:hypothetical protein
VAAITEEGWAQNAVDCSPDAMDSNYETEEDIEIRYSPSYDMDSDPDEGDEYDDDEPEDEDEESAEAEETTEAQDLAEPEVAAEAEPEKTGDDDGDWEAVLLDGFETGGMREEHEQREWYEPVTVSARDLADHLTEQLTLLELTPRQAFLAEEFVGNINDDGWLACPLEEIQRGVNELLSKEAEERDIDADVPVFTDAEMQQMLQIIQDLDPPGVGARSLQECLLLQLRAATMRDSLAYRLVEEAFEELIAHRWSASSLRWSLGSYPPREMNRRDMDLVIDGHLRTAENMLRAGADGGVDHRIGSGGVGAEIDEVFGTSVG